MMTAHLDGDDPSPMTSTSSSNIGSNKRIKLDHVPPVITSRVLLTPGRKIPTNLLLALKRKRAQLIRPPPNGVGSHLVLEFGNAFVMTIYVCPLLVTIRAMNNNNNAKQQQQQQQPPKQEAEQRTTDQPGDVPTANTFLTSMTTNTTMGCATWTPLYSGLQHKSLTVFGVSGTYETLGHVVEERLRDASMHATHVLRKCFRNSVRDKVMEFEVEILESSALLEFSLFHHQQSNSHLIFLALDNARTLIGQFSGFTSNSCFLLFVFFFPSFKRHHLANLVCRSFEPVVKIRRR